MLVTLWLPEGPVRIDESVWNIVVLRQRLDRFHCEKRHDPPITSRKIIAGWIIFHVQSRLQAISWYTLLNLRRNLFLKAGRQQKVWVFSFCFRYTIETSTRRRRWPGKQTRHTPSGRWRCSYPGFLLFLKKSPKSLQWPKSASVATGHSTSSALRT